MTCPECEAELPAGTAFETDAGVGLPDRRTLDCPYCGAPLERLRWRDLLVLAAVLAVVLTARKLLAPLFDFLDWRVVVVAGLVVLAYHVREILRWRRARKQGDEL